MLTLQTRLQTNQEEVAAKVVDGEIVMINLSTGMYYSMGDTGALVWQLLTAGHSLEETASALAHHYDVSSERARADVERLVTQLLEENLMTLSDFGAAPPGLPGAGTQTRRTYKAPVLEIFRDVGHLVALDPPMPGLTDLPWSGPSSATQAP